MANEDKFRRLQCEQACRKMIEEAGGGGLEVVKFVQGDPGAEYTGLKIPFVIALFTTEDDLVSTTLIDYDFGETIFQDPDYGTNYVVAFTNIQYDEDAKQLTANVKLTEQV